MRIRYRPAFLLVLFISGLYACRQNVPPPTENKLSIYTDPPIVGQLQQLIDSGSRWSGPESRKQLKQLKTTALQSGERATGYYYYLEGIHYWYADSNQAAMNSFRQVLPAKPTDTARNFDLIALQQLGMLKLGLVSKVDDSTFASLFRLIELVEKYHYADSWRVYEQAAESYFRFGDYNKAESYTNKAITGYQHKDDHYRMSFFMEELSRIHERRRHFKEAISYEESALHHAQQQPDSSRLATVYSALGVLYEKAGGQRNGHELMEKAFAIKERINKVSFREYLNYGQIQQEEKDYARALIYMNKALDKAREDKSAGNLSDAYNNIYQVYYDKGDYKNAINYLDSAANMALTEQEERQLKKVVEIHALNDLKEQQHKTQDLSRQYNNQAIIMQQQRIILLIITILLVAGIIITVLLIRQRKLKSQKLSIELEQRLLRSQMEPHFIFNTLSVLQSFIRHDEKEKSVKYLNKFARLLRINLENSRHNLVPLHQETEALENYLSLQKIRFANVFDYTINNIEEVDADICIPPMLLQPFVENAIQHGMRNLPYKGDITITLQLNNDMLQCVIEDNGQGLLQKIDKGKNSLSSIITQERLKILSSQTGKLASLTITDKKLEGRTGVKVIMIIPTQRC